MNWNKPEDSSWRNIIPYSFNLLHSGVRMVLLDSPSIYWATGFEVFGRIKLAGETVVLEKKTAPVPIYSPQNPLWLDLKSKPDLRVGKTATNRPSFNTALKYLVNLRNKFARTFCVYEFFELSTKTKPIIRRLWLSFSVFELCKLTAFFCSTLKIEAIYFSETSRLSPSYMVLNHRITTPAASIMGWDIRGTVLP